MNKLLLKIEYLENKKSISKIAKEYNSNYGTIRNRMIEFDIPIRSLSEAGKGNKNALGFKHSKETKELISNLYKGENNPAWKGDKVGYGAIHRWIRNIKPQPNICEKCGKLTKNFELSNNGIYNRDPNNYEYLCYKCHKIKDGTIYNIKHQEGLYVW